jgi:hypothetical protein
MCGCLLGTASDENSKWALFSPITGASSKSNMPQMTHRQGYTLPTHKSMKTRAEHIFSYNMEVSEKLTYKLLILK